jgi:AraC-like DNA-binding protein/mannose-6-phosphate isomerase-like protein (cupin superfamily)
MVMVERQGDTDMPRHTIFPDTNEVERDHIEADFEYFDIDDRLIIEVLKTTNPPHRHDYEEIMWIQSGTAEHLLDGERVTVRSKTLVIVPQGHVHRLMPSLALEGCVVRFKDEFLPTTSFTVFSQFVGLFHLPLSEGDIRVVDALYKLVKDESQKVNRHRRTTIAHLLQALISKIEELKLAPLEGKISALKERQGLWEHFNATIERHFRDEHSVTFYAKELGITPRKLNEVVKLFLGKGVAEAIDERLVLEAKRLILFSSMNIKEIAFELGYDEHSYFSKVFKRVTGLIPSSFRDRMTYT